MTANRRLLIGVYAGLALFSTLVYLSEVNLSLIVMVGPWSGLWIILIALPALLPYLLSGSYAWPRVSESRLALSLFLAVTVVGTAVANLVIIGGFDIRVSTATVFWYVLTQIVVYSLAADLC